MKSKEMSLWRELDRFFEEPGWGLFKTRKFFGPATWMPDVDVFENDNRLVARVDLPGLKKEDVNVEFIDGRLVISGERKYEVEEKKENWYRAEREYGSFYRAIPLPEGVKFENVKAVFTDGVLEISMPVPKAETLSKKVKIEEAPIAAKKTAA